MQTVNSSVFRCAYHLVCDLERGKKGERRGLKAAEIFSLFSLTKGLQKLLYFFPFLFPRIYYATQLPERTWPESLDY